VARGQLRIYLGAAPGVGKTYAMLQEGQRRRERGTDVVIGFVETHDRAQTASQLGELEVVPRQHLRHRGAEFTEMDLDAVLARAPEVALVDELAHTNVPGTRNEKRWQDVAELLDAGIDVISTVNVQHLESLNDVIERITGIEQREVVPDAVVRAADQVQIVDQTPEALRRRMAHGNIYPPERVDAALGNYFRLGNLSALRELALMWVADQVDEGLQQYRERHGIERPWETRERVVVAVTGAPGGDDLIRRAARIAVRAKGELLGVHIRSADGLASESDDRLREHREVLSALGGSYQEVSGADIARALVRFAETHNATQIVLGASRRSRWVELTRGSIINDVNRLTHDIDVHIIPSHDPNLGDRERTPGGRTARITSLSRRRRATGWALAVALPVILTLGLVPLRDNIGLPSDLLAYLLAVIVVATVGGLGPALLAAVIASLLANWYFAEPIHTFTIAERESLFAVFTFLAVAAATGWLVGAAARQTAAASRARGEAETLAALSASSMGDGDDRLFAIVDQLRQAFGARAVSLLRRDGAGWAVESSTGQDPPTTPEDGDRSVEIDATSVVVLSGEPAGGIDNEVLSAFCAQLGNALERRDLQEEARKAHELAEVNELRTGLLAAVSHDLRTPLASIKAAVSSLRQSDVEFPPDVQAELLETIDSQSDRLTTLITNLLGMSRIQAGAVELALRPVGYDEIVSRVLAEVDDRGRSVRSDVDESLPPVSADAALLERIVVNLVDNAVKWSPVDRPVRISAAAIGDAVMLRVVDQGPGIDPDELDTVFEPFQRLGDTSAAEGLGLGLAVARGFADLMGGSVEVEDTPGGGTTFILTMPSAVRPKLHPAGSARREGASTG
jgi:two-component system sensor histidine kinase KdpD